MFDNLLTQSHDEEDRREIRVVNGKKSFYRQKKKEKCTVFSRERGIVESGDRREINLDFATPENRHMYQSELRGIHLRIPTFCTNCICDEVCLLC